MQISAEKISNYFGGTLHRPRAARCNRLGIHDFCRSIHKGSWRLRFTHRCDKRSTPSAISVALTSEYEWSLMGEFWAGRLSAWGFFLCFSFLQEWVPLRGSVEMVCSYGSQEEFEIWLVRPTGASGEHFLLSAFFPFSFVVGFGFHGAGRANPG